MNNLKCPFCNKPLQPTLRQSDEYWCENYDCPRTNIEWVGSQKLWQELIRTRKALDVAKDTIRHADWFFDGDYNVDAKTMHNEIKYAIKAIIALEQKEHFADTSKKIDQKERK